MNHTSRNASERSCRHMNVMKPVKDFLSPFVLPRPPECDIEPRLSNSADLSVETLTREAWEKILLEGNGRRLNELIYNGGISDHDLRKEVWPYLLSVYTLNMNEKQKAETRRHNEMRYERALENCILNIAELSSGDAVDVDHEIVEQFLQDSPYTIQGCSGSSSVRIIPSQAKESTLTPNGNISSRMHNGSIPNKITPENPCSHDMEIDDTIHNDDNHHHNKKDNNNNINNDNDTGNGYSSNMENHSSENDKNNNKMNDNHNRQIHGVNTQPFPNTNLENLDKKFVIRSECFDLGLSCRTCCKDVLKVYDDYDTCAAELTKLWTPLGIARSGNDIFSQSVRTLEKSMKNLERSAKYICNIQSNVKQQYDVWITHYKQNDGNEDMACKDATQKSLGRHLTQIDKDVTRNDAGHPFFRTTGNMEKLRNILLCFVSEHPTHGYAQGMRYAKLAFNLEGKFDNKSGFGGM